VEGRKLSIITSACVASASSTAAASAFRRSSVTLRLFRLRRSHGLRRPARPQRPHPVAAARILDLDHLGAKIREQQRRGPGAGA
jgi:hypothetical protein